ncbi:hypothetical protein ACLB2K_015927 [Fragaria x ananassa]
MKERVLIRQEEEGNFIFQFKDQKVKDRILNGGSWFFNNVMLLLVDYDGVVDLVETAASLHYLRVFVAVRDGFAQPELIILWNNLFERIRDLYCVGNQSKRSFSSMMPVGEFGSARFLSSHLPLWLS